MKTSERYTKIEKIRSGDGEWIRVGDLVAHWWDALTASRWIQGEVVDVRRGKVCIEDSNGDQSWVYASHMKGSDVVLSCRG